jgi:septum formation protein
LGLSFEVIPSSVLEHEHPEWTPVKRSVELARLKALDISEKNPGAVVIGCDTLVVSEKGELLEKPKDESEAEAMIRAHSGATSLVHSALCIVDAKGKLHEGVSSSTVTFKELSEEEIAWWIGTGLWHGRSGGFQIDGPGQLMISRIDGDWTSIVGLPVFLLGELLEKTGVRVSSR